MIYKCPKCKVNVIYDDIDHHQCGLTQREIKRQHLKHFLSICKSNRCGNYGTDKYKRTGCLLLLPKCPTRIEDHLLDGGGCLADPPLFGPNKH